MVAPSQLYYGRYYVNTLPISLDFRYAPGD
jgi:hypothetical protein